MSPLESIYEAPKSLVCWAFEEVGVQCTYCGSAKLAGAACGIYAFGLYALLLGVFMAVIARDSFGRKLRVWIGLPEQAEPWLDVFCTTLILVGVLYVVAGVANLRPVFWAMVVGRLAIGFACGWFVAHDKIAGERKRLTTRSARAAVLLIAAPDVITAMITAGQLLSPRSAELPVGPFSIPGGNLAPLWVFTIGVSDVVAGLMIMAFPELLRKCNLFHETIDPANPDDMDPHVQRWAGVFAVLLTAIGAYELVAALNGYLPYFWATIVVNVLFFAVSLVILLLRPLSKGKRSWPLFAYGSFELVLALFALYSLTGLSSPAP